MLTQNIDGRLLSRQVTNSCNFGMAVTNRRTLRIRARRSTGRNSLPRSRIGSSKQAVTIRKSKTFHGFLKQFWGCFPSARILITTSIRKTQRINPSSMAKREECLEEKSLYVCAPTTIAARRIVKMMNLLKQGFCAIWEN